MLYNLFTTCLNPSKNPFFLNVDRPPTSSSMSEEKIITTIMENQEYVNTMLTGREIRFEYLGKKGKISLIDKPQLPDRRSCEECKGFYKNFVQHSNIMECRCKVPLVVWM
ncbi:hypothetical protein TetV_102 [Tetraselmis virus 1]|uniref:Uncharacterized protein n=1 Tax=Tetraselmis virus 1 TaxID=2060617 RepID=A0A2P0VMR8_9VIRU|nr:hypothetical protein QJ968_gp102 [Tetraselmis virus 1]AUF82194.1 hypothetical protein TetV_102 [Tetraselmis virus 1]